jgi:predicted ribosomally synthesized peptide with SipW-like signal peptide
MTKKMLGIVAVLAALAILAFGLYGTYAWFTDAGEITGNSVTTGSLDMKVWGGPFVGEKMEPGADYKTMGTFCVENIGDYDMKMRGWMTDVVDAKNLRQYVLVRATMNPEGNVGNYGPANALMFTDIPLSELTQANDYFSTDHEGTEAIYKGLWACWKIDAKVMGTAPNSVQNALITSKMYIQATQFINEGWSQ